MKKTIKFMGILALLSGCVTAASFYPKEIPEAQVNRVIAQVKSDMRDPSSASFRNIRTFAMHDRADVVICGEANGTNAYGGHTGFLPFRATIDSSNKINYYSRGRNGEFDAIGATATPC